MTLVTEVKAHKHGGWTITLATSAGRIMFLQDAATIKDVQRSLAKLAKRRAKLVERTADDALIAEATAHRRATKVYGVSPALAAPEAPKARPPIRRRRTEVEASKAVHGGGLHL